MHSKQRLALINPCFRKNIQAPEVQMYVCTFMLTALLSLLIICVNIFLIKVVSAVIVKIYTDVTTM